VNVMSDESYMRLALELARSAQGQTGVNPVVGCVIVKDGRIVGMGAHLQRGKEHAEIHALNMAGPQAEGATVYVTLEPCSHHGRTPPCSDRLIRERVGRVVVAAVDPNPLVAGAGIAKLRSHGIATETGLLADEATALNEAFNKYITTRRPFVTLKTASTLDGKIAAKSGDSKWITNEASRAYVHTLRHRHQGIMVGVGTVLADDPELTARLSVPAVQPTRIIVDSALRIPLHAKVLQRQDTNPTIVLTTERAAEASCRELERLGVTVIRCGKGPLVDLEAAMDKLGEMEIGSVLLEGGGTLNGAMLQRRLVDKIILFFAPKIIGGKTAPAAFQFEGYERMADAVKLERLSLERFAEDVCLTGYPVYYDEARKEAGA
jgi:diaminohydroxyphosphoribosylaminopyrimidine deaminase/5-amino-6-(5-phosphoribosylamino)uracil reductase